uniref:Uncharacterized protein n=1 Tax=Aegilops tauschii subsp. strangulata TaxID=200361 RepID=A0A453J6E7_AEGTS
GDNMSRSASCYVRYQYMLNHGHQPFLISDAQDLYMMGARKVGIINAGLSGCIPMARADDATGACNDGTNELAAGFNGALESFLADLAPRLPGLAYSLADGFAHRQVLIADPQAAGFVSATSACCGSAGGSVGRAIACRRRTSAATVMATSTGTGCMRHSGPLRWPPRRSSMARRSLPCLLLSSSWQRRKGPT